MDQISKTLIKFGLTDNETKIYLETLKEDDLSPFKLAHLTGIPRTTIYEILMNLSLKGLVRLESSDGFTKQQTRVKAKNPSILRDLLWQKRQDISNLELEIVDILPSLKGDYHQSESNADFQFFPGIQGVKKVYFTEYIANPHLPIHAIDNMMPMDVFGRQAVNQDIDKWLSSKPQQNTEIKEVIGLTPWTKHVLGYQLARDPEYFKYRNIRYIDDPHFIINQRIVIQGTTLRIATSHQEEVWGLVINSPSLSQSWQSIFQFLWHQSTPITIDLIKSWGKNEFYQAENKSQK